MGTGPGPVQPCSGAPRAPLTIAATLFGRAVPSSAGLAIGVAHDGVFYDDGLPSGADQTTILFTPFDATGGPLATQTEIAVPPSPLGPGPGGPLALDASNLYFFGGNGVPGTTFLAARALSGGATSVVRQLDTGSLIDMWTIPVGGVMWIELHDAPTAGANVFLWNPPDPIAQVESLPDTATGIAGDARRAFVVTSTQLFMVPFPHGPATPIASVSSAGQILGWYEGILFYTPDGKTIVRREAASGNQRVLTTGPAIAPSLHGAGGHVGWADDSFLYYSIGTPRGATELRRISLEGGPPETIWNDAAHPPTGAVATDACNVYWIAARAPSETDGAMAVNGPSLLMVRSKQ